MITKTDAEWILEGYKALGHKLRIQRELFIFVSGIIIGILIMVFNYLIFMSK